MSKAARDMVKAETGHGEAVGALLETLLSHAWEVGPDEVYDYLRHIEVEFDGVSVTMGWRGRFRGDIARWVRSVLKSCDIAGFRGGEPA